MIVYPDEPFGGRWLDVDRAAHCLSEADVHVWLSDSEDQKVPTVAGMRANTRREHLEIHMWQLRGGEQVRELSALYVRPADLAAQHELVDDHPRSGRCFRI